MGPDPEFVRSSMASSLIQPDAGWFLNTCDPASLKEFIHPDALLHGCAKTTDDVFELAWSKLVDAFAHWVMQNSHGLALVFMDQWSSITLPRLF